MKPVTSGNKPVPRPTESDQTPSEQMPSNQPKQPQALTEVPTRKNPRAVAALTLVEQGRALIKAKKPDDAIRVLERAMNLHPQNGKIYYYLSEAWLTKGNIRQATEYNRQAERYFQSAPDWAGRVSRQKKEIQSR